MNMKKLLGLVVLSGVPVACGTAPTAPELDAAAPSNSAEGGFAASGRGRAADPGCPADPDWSSIKGLVLQVTNVGKTSVTVRAELLVIGDMGPTPCFTPAFTVKPTGRGITLTGGKDPHEVTLSAPEGSYRIMASLDDERDLTGSLLVELPQKGRR